mmetsp:Transcript_4098/g.5664  ORF Transcript_4098/g.5664 Transcript_4098/m.5664 type:complete len:90 (+) Transcript_4098:55-324(+)
MALKEAKMKSSKRKKGKKKGPSTLSSESFTFLDIDPNNIRFAHSRIRPYFSGCGRSLHDTLNDIKDRKITLEELPFITVIEGPCVDDIK